MPGAAAPLGAGPEDAPAPISCSVPGAVLSPARPALLLPHLTVGKAEAQRSEDGLHEIPQMCPRRTQEAPDTSLQLRVGSSFSTQDAAWGGRCSHLSSGRDGGELGVLEEAAGGGPETHLGRWLPSEAEGCSGDLGVDWFRHASPGAPRDSSWGRDVWFCLRTGWRHRPCGALGPRGEQT